MTKLKITVTKEILKKSSMCGHNEGLLLDLVSQNCAIALAIRDVFPDASVGSDRMSFGTDPYHFDGVDLSEKVKNFIYAFDISTPEARARMKPFSFEIEIPDSVINQINIDELKPLLTNHPTLELVEQN